MMHKDAREHEEIYKIGGLRDQLAIAASQAIISRYGSKATVSNISGASYEYADAMLMARKIKDVA